jgi:hypothetical protein
MKGGSTVRHIVMWRLSSPELRQQLDRDESLAQLLMSMRRSIPGLLRIELGMNECASPDASDLVLYSEFEDWQALKVYEAHPLHDQFKRLVGPLRSERRVVDYEKAISHG